MPHPIRLASGEVLNDQKPIWVEPKSQVTEEQYTRFYQHLTHHTEETPLWHLHLAVDSPIQFRAVLYCPPTNLERFGFARLEHGVNLCAKRILVQSDCRELAARIPPVPSRPRRFRGSAAERLARDAARQHGDPADPHIAGQGRARPARYARQGAARRLQEVHAQFGIDAQGRGDRRPGQSRADRQPAPIRLVAVR